MILLNEKDLELKRLKSLRPYLEHYPVETHIKGKRYIFADFLDIDELIKKIENNEDI